jgi:AcrR family transcriptional regulator
MATTRERILEAALRLFADQGFKATTVKQIELAAGLSAGAGGLYRHFSSKQELLEATVQWQVAANRELVEQLAAVGPPADAEPGSDLRPDLRPDLHPDLRPDLRSELTAVARSGLARLETEQGLTRLLLRDLKDHPRALALAGQGDIEPVLTSLAGYLRSRDSSGRVDPAALAVIVAGATTNFWLLRDIFGTHPAGITADDFVDTLASLVELALTAR